MTTIDAPYLVATGRRVRAAEPLHGEIVEHLEDEAQILDEDDLMGWIQMLDQDVVYRAPIRMSTERGTGSPFAEEAAHYEENAMTLFLKVMRLTQTSSAWAENPASRTRRIVSNVRVYETDIDNEYRVDSSILLLRSRYDDTHYDLLSGRRVDTLRRVDDGFRLAVRTIYFDQTALGVHNLAVYL